MKFNLVPSGAAFSYQGIMYTKSGPISACADLDGKSRMIPRSANVTLGNSIAAGEDVMIEAKQIPLAEVLNALNDYHLQCLESVQVVSSEASKETLAGIKKTMNNAHQRLIKYFNTM